MKGVEVKDGEETVGGLGQETGWSGRTVKNEKHYSNSRVNGRVTLALVIFKVHFQA